MYFIRDCLPSGSYGLIKAEDSLIDTSEEAGHSVFDNQPAGMEFVKGASADSD